MILSMLVNSLLQTLSTVFFVAQISEDAMTALSLVISNTNFVNSVAVGFGIGINVMIAFCLGAGDQLHAHKAASQGFFLSIIHGILLSITGILIMPSFLKLFTHSENILSLGLRYSNIVLLFFNYYPCGNHFRKILSGDGDDGCQYAQYALRMYSKYYP